MTPSSNRRIKITSTFAPTLSSLLSLEGTYHQERIIWIFTDHFSDTTAATLSALFYELAQHPEAVTKLQKEMDGAFEKGEVDYTGLSKQPYLQACIDEA